MKYMKHAITVILTIGIGTATLAAEPTAYLTNLANKGIVDKHGGCSDTCGTWPNEQYYWLTGSPRLGNLFPAGAETLAPNGTCKKNCYGAYAHTLYTESDRAGGRMEQFEIYRAHNFSSEKEAKIAAITACKKGQKWSKQFIGGDIFDGKYQQCKIGATFSGGECIAIAQRRDVRKHFVGIGLGKSEDLLEVAINKCAEESKLDCGGKPKKFGSKEMEKNHPNLSYYSLCNK